MNGQSGSGTLLPLPASAFTKIYRFHIPDYKVNSIWLEVTDFKTLSDRLLKGLEYEIV